MEVKSCRKALRLMDRYSLHSHEGASEIIYQLEGRTTASVGERSFVLKPGDVLMIPEGVAHRGDGEGGLFTDMYVQAQGVEINEPMVVHDVDGAILQLMEMIYRVTTERSEGYHRVADSLLEAICAYIKKNMAKKCRYDFVDGFKNIIYENLSNAEFDVAKEIRRSGYSADHFRRCFKEDTGQTPFEYVTSLRINRAKKLLCSIPPQSVESIAEGCGFSDGFYFSRVFKKYTGLSPREYRKSRLKKESEISQKA